MSLAGIVLWLERDTPSRVLFWILLAATTAWGVIRCGGYQ